MIDFGKIYIATKNVHMTPLIIPLQYDCRGGENLHAVYDERYIEYISVRTGKYFSDPLWWVKTEYELYDENKTEHRDYISSYSD